MLTPRRRSMFRVFRLRHDPKQRDGSQSRFEEARQSRPRSRDSWVANQHPMAILSHLAVMLAAAACRPGPRLRWQRSANSGPQRRGAWLDSSDDIRLSEQSIWRPPMVANRISRRGTLVAEASEPREQRAMTSTPITNQAHPASLSVRKMRSDQRAPVRTRPAKPWPAFVIGFGLAASVAWTAALGWLVVKAVRLIL